MANLAIRGHATRGKEVIQILKMLGGDNSYLYATGNIEDLIYFISENKRIIEYSRTLENGLPQFLIFTLEEFLEMFPYKVGDKVMISEYESEVRIYKMYWDGYDVKYMVYRCDEEEYYSADELNDYNEPYCKEQETMEELTIGLAPNQLDGEQVIIPVPKGYEFVGVDDDKQQVVFEKIKPKYPKTYEECCKVLDIQSDWHLTFESNNSASCDLYVNKEFEYVCKLEAFRKLIICRDAYWKLAGEQMGLDKPWEPDWEKFIQPSHYIIIRIDNFKHLSYILAFPTREMRDAFYENFKDLIEQCKELL